MSDIATKLTAVADNIPKVYEAGRKAERDAFWEEFNRNAGSSLKGPFMFAGPAWSDKTFDPPRGSVIQPESTYMMFANTRITDLVKICEERNVTIDFSKATDITNPFYGAYGGSLTHVGVIDTRSSTKIASIAYGARELTTIDLIILKDDGSQTFTTPFNNASSLANIAFEGCIGKTVSFADSPLSVASMKSVISCLKNLTGTSTAGVNKITFNDACWTKLEADSAAPDGGTWRSYVENTMGWAT